MVSVEVSIIFIDSDPSVVKMGPERKKMDHEHDNVKVNISQHFKVKVTVIGGISCYNGLYDLHKKTILI